jgi:endonuclease YncB( thermonuclease family)
MVKRGLAEVYRERYPERLYIVPYLEAEKQAKAAGQGMWFLGEKYISPQDWRKMYKARYSIR